MAHSFPYDKDYKILSCCDSPTSLEESVNDHIEHGYHLAGGMFATMDGRVFYQAVVRVPESAHSIQYITAGDPRVRGLDGRPVESTNPKDADAKRLRFPLQFPVDKETVCEVVLPVGSMIESFGCDSHVPYVIVLCGPGVYDPNGIKYVAIIPSGRMPEETDRFLGRIEYCGVSIAAYERPTAPKEPEG